MRFAIKLATFKVVYESFFKNKPDFCNIKLREEKSEREKEEMLLIRFALFIPNTDFFLLYSSLSPFLFYPFSSVFSL